MYFTQLRWFATVSGGALAVCSHSSSIPTTITGCHHRLYAFVAYWVHTRPTTTTTMHQIGAKCWRFRCTTGLECSERACMCVAALNASNVIRAHSLFQWRSLLEKGWQESPISVFQALWLRALNLNCGQFGFKRQSVACYAACSCMKNMNDIHWRTYTPYNVT